MKKSKKRPYLKWALLGTGLAVLLVGTGVFAFQLTQFPESVYLSKTKVAGFYDEDPSRATQFASFAELDAAIQVWAETRLNQPLTLTSDRGPKPVTLAGLGAHLETAILENDVKNFMESSGAFGKIRTYLFGQSIEIPTFIDSFVFDSALLATGIEQASKNAAFMWDGSKVTIQSGEQGYAIQKEELLTFMQSSLQLAKLPEFYTLTLLVSAPEVMDEELVELLPVAEGLAGKSVTLQDEFGNTWDVAMKDHLDWIVPSKDGGELATQDQNTWSLDEGAFVSYAETTLVPEVEEDPTGVVITQAADGSIAFEGSARFGKDLDKTALMDLVFAKLNPAPEATAEEMAAPIALPITKVMPAVTVPDSLKQKGITDLVGLGYSDFGGSPSGRVHNIQTGIAQYNGVVIEQGAEFSFMEQMSPVDAANGFVPELVIKGDETIPEYGGGLCQISSTMFRAALYSGLPITARRNHSYAVSYYARPYGYGLDATVYDPAPDFKFVNDTAGALLVQAYTEGDSAFYVFYGTNDARTVTMEGPYAYNYNSISAPSITYTDKLAPGEQEVKEHGHTGFTVDWYRTVTYVTPEEGYVSPYAATASGVRENIHSVYEARPTKIWEGQAEGGAEATDTTATSSEL